MGWLSSGFCQFPEHQRVPKQFCWFSKNLKLRGCGGARRPPKMVGRWSEGGRKVVVWRLQPGSQGVVLCELAVAARVSIFGSCSAIPHVICFLNTASSLSDQQAARISHLGI